MAEVENFVDTDRKINYNLYMDLVDRMRRKARGSTELQEKINAMTIFDLRLRARPANPSDRDLYIERMEELSDRVNSLPDSPDSEAKVEELLFRMWAVLEIFVEQSRVFKNDGKRSVTGKPITREEMSEVRGK
nr:hypothetical protein [Ferrimicrobium acidiphilum]